MKIVHADVVKRTGPLTTLEQISGVVACVGRAIVVYLHMNMIGVLFLGYEDKATG